MIKRTLLLTTLIAACSDHKNDVGPKISPPPPTKVSIERFVDSGTYTLRKQCEASHTEGLRQYDFSHDDLPFETGTVIIDGDFVQLSWVKRDRYSLCTLKIDSDAFCTFKTAYGSCEALSQSEWLKVRLINAY